MSILLRPVAITDLSVKYARDLGDRKVRHYRVPVMMAVAKNLSGEDVTQLVRDYIRDEEKETQDVIFESKAQILHGKSDEAYRGATLKATDVSSVVFRPNDKIRKALKKQQATSLLVQYNWYPSVFHKYRDKFANFYNRFIANPLNKLLLPGGTARLGAHIDKAINDHFRFELPVSYMNYTYLRKFHLVRYLSVAFRASQTVEATEAMMTDLRMLYDKGLIEGSLAMPSIMELADTVGVGERYYVMFCFPLINEHKLAKALGVDLVPHDLPLNKLGLKYESFEGGVNWLNGVTLDKYYQIEEVNISDPTSDEIRAEMIKLHDEATPLVNKIAKVQKEQIRKMEALSKAVELDSSKKLLVIQQADVEASKKFIQEREAMEKEDKAKKDE